MTHTRDKAAVMTPAFTKIGAIYGDKGFGGMYVLTACGLIEHCSELASDPNCPVCRERLAVIGTKL